MDATRQHPSQHLSRILVAMAGGCMAAWVPMLAAADGAHVAQHAKPGDIVVTRNVATRPAYRAPTAPGMALMVNPSPNPQLADSLAGSASPGEMTDAEIAGLNAGPHAAGLPGQNSIQHSITNALGVGGSSTGAVSGNGVSSAVSAPAGGGAVVDGTRSIGDQVTNAVSQIPVLGAGR